MPDGHLIRSTQRQSRGGLWVARLCPTAGRTTVTPSVCYFGGGSSHSQRGKAEWQYETHNPAAHTRSMACTRGSVWQVGRQQWLLVHVLAHRRRLSREAHRKQRGVARDRQPWFPAGP